MSRRLVFLTLTLISCSGPITQTCPDGEPVNVLRSIEDAYPAYVRNYEATFNAATAQLGKIASDAKIEATVKNKAVRLRQELDQERAELENQQKSVVIALQTAPCDKEVRKKAMDFLVDVKSKTNHIPDRLRELNDETSAKIKSDASNLLHYPEASRDIAAPPTMFEAMLINKLPGRLFDLLYAYDDNAILNVPNVGALLRDHKIAYYSFRQGVSKLEDSLMLRVGEKVQVRFRQAWRIYLQYLLARFGGNSKEQIIAHGNFLNYDITWDDCERLFEDLSKDQSLSKALSDAFTLHSSLAEGVNKIASAI